MLVGTIVAVVQVHVSSTLALEGLKARFAGPETADISTHSLASLLQTTHTHLFTLAFMQFMLGGLFLLSSASKGLKGLLAGGGFAFILLDQASMWLAKGISPAWVPLIWVAGTLMSVAFCIQIFWCMGDLVRRR